MQIMFYKHNEHCSAMQWKVRKSNRKNAKKQKPDKALTLFWPASKNYDIHSLNHQV